MTTVFEGILAIADRLPGHVSGIADGGGDFYLTDMAQLSAKKDDTFNFGALLMVTGDAAGALLPVSNSVQSSGRVDGTVDIWWTQDSEQPAAGDRYTVTPNQWPCATLVNAITEALRAWGQVETLNTMGTGDGATTTWSLQGGLTGTITRVYMVTDDDDQRVELMGWEPISGGVELQIKVPTDYTVKAMVTHYASDYNTLTLSGTLPSQIPLEYIASYGTYVALRNALPEPGVDNEMYEGLLNHYVEMAQAAKVQSGYRGARSREHFRVG